MTHTIKLTAEYVKRVKSSISETEKLILKEMKISEDLRYHSKIEGWKAHILKLNGFLKAGKVVSEIPE